MLNKCNNKGIWLFFNFQFSIFNYILYLCNEFGVICLIENEEKTKD